MAFFVFAGPRVLDPTNIAWLQYGDRAMHQLGWMAFRHAPWTWPPGASPDLGIELSNSIGLVDGLPLFALPFKLIGSFLPEPFQYWGIWLLMSFVLQGIFGYRLARALGVGQVASIVAAGFVLATPAFLYRVPMHMALSGHWTILAALWLCARPTGPKAWHWPLLAVITSAIHVYLLAMVMALWVASLLQRVLPRALDRRSAGTEIVATFAAVLAVLYVAGFFMTGSLGAYGFGAYKLNLLWPLITYGWSQVLPDLPHTRYDYEGLSFPGIGVLVLMGLSILTGAVLHARSLFQNWWPLAAMVVALAVFAVSHQPAILDHEWFTLPLPESLIDLLSAFRSSGRFVWPLLYLATIGAIALLARRLPPRTLGVIAALALAAQIADSAPKWREFREDLPPSAPVWTTPLTSPFWDRAADAGYTRVRAIPLQAYGGDWEALSYYAVTHHLATDAVYLGRTDEAAKAQLIEATRQALANGTFEPRTLYVFDEEAASAAAKHLKPGDLLAEIDDRVVFARDGARLVDGLGIDPQSAR